MSWLWISAARLVPAVVAFVTLLAAPVAAQERKPGPLGPTSGPYREQEWLIPWERAERTYLAHAKIYRPEGEQRQPLLIIAHGAPRGGENERPRMNPNWADTQARWFTAQGFVVVVPMRRGYGRSDGPYTEGSGKCEDPDYFNQSLTTANDMQGVLRHMVKEPYVDGSRIVVVGQSAGGWGTLGVVSRNPEGVIAYINFAGGRGNTAPGTVCTPSRLVEAAARLGQTARVPGIWLYTSNDSFFNSDLSRAMFAGYTAAGGPAEYKAMGSFGSDGHSLFTQTTGMSTWTPVVTEFLRAQKLMK